MKVKLADFIANRLAELGISQVFMVTGGGSMHLNHSIATHPSITCTHNHHEQACAMAADSYFRMSGKLATVNVTTGPGATNAITGVYGAWTDSLGMLVISGQVKWETTVQSTDLPLRQLGDQEIDIIESVRSLTKYAITVTDPNSIKYHLDKAIYLAKSGRPGPTWIDIPMNVQASIVDTDKLSDFDPSELDEPWKNTDLPKICQTILEKLSYADRPVILAGTGIRLSGSTDIFNKVVDALQIPVTTAWNAHDLIPDDHPLYAGRPGTIGTRAGNFTVQNSDLLLILGSRLNIRQVSYEWKSFARESYKIWVDIDESELKKPTVRPDLPVHADLNDFLQELFSATSTLTLRSYSKWIKWCKTRVTKYPVVLSDYRSSKLVNPYVFVDSLTERLSPGDIVVTGDGSACVVTFQAAIIKKNQRLYTNGGCAAMGYDLPAAIGAALAVPGNRVICLAGDGSVMMNLQELQTIRGNSFPITIFLLNNSGYASIAQTHNNYFNGVEVGCSEKSGLSFPRFESVARAFDLDYCRIDNSSSLCAGIKSALASSNPILCEILVDPLQPFSPKLSSRQLADGSMISSPLEDMAPFLDRDELDENLLINSYEGQ